MGSPTTDFVPDVIANRVLVPVEEHVRKLTDLKDLGGDQFNVYLMHDAMNETLEAYRQETIPTAGRGATVQIKNQLT